MFSVKHREDLRKMNAILVALHLDNALNGPLAEESLCRIFVKATAYYPSIRDRIFFERRLMNTQDLI